MPYDFLFATGIANASPTIGAERKRVDAMEKCGHYTHMEADFDRVAELGVEFLWYGVPLHRTWLAHDRYAWDVADFAFESLRRRAIHPIVDLCHFGVPAFIGDFQNADFACLFAEYASAFARRYPWVQLYTPINEIFVCALLSGQLGYWNERGTSDKTFVTALKHMARANVLAMSAILEVRPDAIFIQSEASAYYHAHAPDVIGRAEWLNAKRFLSLDLNYGRRVESEMYEYLLDNGMTRQEYHWFLDNHLKRHCIMGNDYFAENQRRVRRNGAIVSDGEVFGYEEITLQYYDRYRLPVMHTQTNREEGPCGDEAVRWLKKEWANVLRVRNDGIPIIGFTWYPLTDLVDWDSFFSKDVGRVNAIGLFDLDRSVRAVGRAYKQLVTAWRAVLPTQSVCLTVPLARVT